MCSIDDRLKAFIIARSRKGEKCRNVAGGMSFYVLCNTCGVNYKKNGKAAIPNAWKDSRMTASMCAFSKKAPGWIH
jgi:hypothetical protein